MRFRLLLHGTTTLVARGYDANTVAEMGTYTLLLVVGDAAWCG